MGVFSPLKNLLGADGYLRVQKESAYGTPIVNAMTFLPILPDTNIHGEIHDIVNTNVINSRLKQDPNAGRRVVAGDIKMDVYPDLIGLVMNWLLGASSNTGDASTGYVHTWLLPNSGERISTSYTIEQALGAQNAWQFAGCMITDIKITSDHEKNQKITLKTVGYDWTTNVSRPVTFTYSTKTPFYFGQGKVELTPTGTTKFEQYVRSFDLDINLGYLVDDFRVGSNKIIQPSFKTIPSVKLKLNVDADENFRNYAASKLETAILLSFDSGQQAGAVSGNYQYFVEIPNARLSSKTAPKNSMDKMTMDLDFDCSYGGVTTGSPSTPVMAEVRVVDAAATYPA